MTVRPEAVALAIAAALLVVWVVTKAVFVRRALPLSAAAKAALQDAKKRARAATDGEPRMRAWLDAAALALEHGRPSLSASYALRAERADRTAVEPLVAIERALLAARRHRALERLLWRRLGELSGPAQARALTALAALYDGPLRKRERARALRALGPPAS